MSPPLHARTFCFALLALLAAAMFLVVGGSMTQAGPPREWTRITDATGSNTDEVALARTSDGVLHVAWLRKSGKLADLMHTAIIANGQVVGSPAPILPGWASLTNPDMIVTSDGGLRIFFGGSRSDDGSDPYREPLLYTAASDASGTRWTLREGAVSASTTAYASPTGAGMTSDGTPVIAWATTYGLGVHFGLDPKKADENFQKDCCAYHPDVATDPVTGEVVLGWFSNAKPVGLFTQTIAPLAEAKQLVPGSETSGLSQRIAITARRGGPGVYVAYCAGTPTCKSVNIWWHGSEEPAVVAAAEGARFVNVAPGPDGRLWIMWVRNRRIYATRMNRQATTFGAIVSVDSPKGVAAIWKLKGEGSNGPLDVLLSASPDINAPAATWHTQMLPGLTLTAKPTTFHASYGANIAFAVTDAGEAVVGATISVGGRKLTSDRRGLAFYPFPQKGNAGSFTATASKSGYTSGSLRLTAK